MSALRVTYKIRLGTRSESNTNLYSMVWYNVPAGQYYLSAQATDNLGATSTSSRVNITVASPYQRELSSYSGD